MRLQPCTWQQVATALRRCGVEVLHETADDIAVGRMPFVKIISKHGMVPVSIQRDLLVSFGLLVTEYQSFLPDSPSAN